LTRRRILRYFAHPMYVFSFLFLFGLTAHAVDLDPYKGEYQGLLDRFFQIEALPVETTTSSFTGEFVSLDSYPIAKLQIQSALQEVETTIFGKTGLVKVVVVKKLSKNAIYDLASNSVVLSLELIENISANYKGSERNLYVWVIAHEIGHLLMTHYCNESVNRKTPAGNTCSNSAPVSENYWDNEYEFVHAFSEEHVEIDYLSYMVMDKLGISTSPVYAYLEASPVPWGESKRFTDALQKDRENRIMQAYRRESIFPF
jgi:hypothetical protein